MRFSLVIPCYNEAPNLPLVLESCKYLFERPDVEVLVIDNGSTVEEKELKLITRQLET